MSKMQWVALLGVAGRTGAVAAECRAAGLVGGNATAAARHNARALQTALAECYTVVVEAGTFKIAPITLPSHRTLFLDHGAALVGSDAWEDYGVTPFLPRMGRQMQLRPVVSAINATNVTLTGANGTLDGNGWFAWPAANWSSPDCGLGGRCAPDVFFGNATVGRLRPPHVLTFVNCSGVTVRNVTVTNPAFWGVQHFFCNHTRMSHVTILAPRWTREIAGFMPWSVADYAVEDSYVEVGDDALAIMSGPSAPSTRLVFRRLFIRGRSAAIGSADFGNVTDVEFDDCQFGDAMGSSPWAFKIKMHPNRASRVANIVFQGCRFGNITSNSWQDPKVSSARAPHPPPAPPLTVIGPSAMRQSRWDRIMTGLRWIRRCLSQ